MCVNRINVHSGWIASRYLLRTPLFICIPRVKIQGGCTDVDDLEIL
jgi:hypothetical protein